MILEELLKNIEVKSIAGSADVDIKDVDIGYSDRNQIACSFIEIVIRLIGLSGMYLDTPG